MGLSFANYWIISTTESFFISRGQLVFLFYYEKHIAILS